MNASFYFVFIDDFINFLPVIGRFKHIYFRMKNSIFSVVIVVCILVLGLGMNACKSKSKAEKSNTENVVADNSKNSLDWDGTYAGTVPCANCGGIITQITLKKDSTYSLQIEYAGKENSVQNFEGTFQWNESGSTVILNGLKEKSMPSSYFVGENRLTQLDMDGNVITGDLASNYVLSKINGNLVEKKWKLIEINGVAIASKNPQPAVEAFIFFQVDGNKVYGNSGCNNFTGTYKSEGGGMKFSGMVSTRKMCIDMTIENQMNSIFQNIDSYSLLNDTLNLNQGNTTLERFVVSE